MPRVKIAWINFCMNNDTCIAIPLMKNRRKSMVNIKIARIFQERLEIDNNTSR